MLNEVRIDPMPRAPDWRPSFAESLPARLRRWGLGTAYALKPERIHLLPRLALMTVAHGLKPKAERARVTSRVRYFSDEGLVDICNNLSPENLIAAYRRGVFPFCHIGPMKWWSPNDRAVLFLGNAHIESRLRKLIRQHKYRVTFDRDFASVMRFCAVPRSGKTPLTWITPRVIDAYWALHEKGYAHSVEVWDANDRLAGGMYGIALGKVFFGESQFSFERDTSKLAAATLNCHLASWGFTMRDAKWMTHHHAQAGFTAIPRYRFAALLVRDVRGPDRIGRWSVDPSLDVSRWRPELSPPLVADPGETIEWYEPLMKAFEQLESQ